MKIAVNTRLLIENKLAGIGHFTFEVLKRIVTSHPEHEFIFLFDRPFSEKFVFAENITPVSLFPPARHPLLFYWWFEYSIPRVLRQHGADLFISMDNFLSLRLELPSLLVIHDLAFEHYPLDIPRSHRLHYQYFVPKFARKANRIATISTATKNDIIHTYQIEADKIDIVSLGRNDYVNRPPEKKQMAIRDQYTGGHPYFVNLGTVQPRKNLKNLIEAFDGFKSTNNNSVRLLLVGRKGWKDQAILQAYENSPFKEEIIFTGYLDDLTLTAVLHGAIALTCVSYFEGFGMPVIEAQACGCPVIASEVSSLPEAGGDAALYVDPFSVADIATAMDKIYHDQELRQELIAKGRINCKKFTWERTGALLWQSVEIMLQNI